MDADLVERLTVAARLGAPVECAHHDMIVVPQEKLAVLLRIPNADHVYGPL